MRFLGIILVYCVKQISSETSDQIPKSTQECIPGERYCQNYCLAREFNCDGKCLEDDRVCKEKCVERNQLCDGECNKDKGDWRCGKECKTMEERSLWVGNATHCRANIKHETQGRNSSMLSMQHLV